MEDLKNQLEIQEDNSKLEILSHIKWKNREVRTMKSGITKLEDLLKESGMKYNQIKTSENLKQDTPKIKAGRKKGQQALTFYYRK